MSDVALELASITKAFGRLAALKSASLVARRGTVHALLGENGAGKTTLMRIAFGMLQPDSGTILVNGVVSSFATPADAMASGISMVHQHFTLVPAMTVAENIALGGRGLYDPSRTREAISALAMRTGLPIDPSARVGELAAGAQQRVEILKALSHEPRVLILDEPTAVLTPAEAQDLLHKAREIVSSGGTAILITHKLRDALEFADDITVLRRGATVWTGPAADASEEILISAMLGGEHFKAITNNVGTGAMHLQPGMKERGRAGEVVMTLREVGVRDAMGVDRLSSVTMTVRAGEIVGIAAVEGNGQHELLRLLAGRMKPTTGEIKIPETVGFIPEDRQRDALIQDFSLRDNVALHGSGARRGLLDWTAIRAATKRLMLDYDVRARDERVRARTLSGGNQQKFVVGREIDGSSAALVAENPSRGLDVQAASAVHARLVAARSAGMAVVIFSSDLDEVLSLADRIMVVYAGHVSETTGGHESIGRAMLGARSE
ncbi:MAG: ABC transporter ATP-binding protein [Gemmatimonadaceae bacterium]